MRASLGTPLLSLSILVWSDIVTAQTMTPAIDRLVDPTTSGCRTAGGAIASNYGDANYQACAPDNAAFHRLVSQYAFAFAPTAMHSASTTGLGGWHVAVEGAY